MITRRGPGMMARVVRRRETGRKDEKKKGTNELEE
jgi:hypothetical protein